jgi:hypothetical protein
MNIKQSYLMWVGATHYKSITEYTEEAALQGISKRVSNMEMAKTLLENGTAIFLIHDEGNYSECPDCVGVVECGECRKRSQEAIRLDMEVVQFSYKTAKDQDEKVRIKKLIDRRKDKASKLRKNSKICSICGGKGNYNAGTGGTVHIDGKQVDYRQYNYWLHQPKIWVPGNHTIKEKTMCETCGGTGRLPQGHVFGLFLPDAVEYILKNDDTEAIEQEMKDNGMDTVKTAVVDVEPKRGCGKRHPGGLYVVTKPNHQPSKDIKDVVERLIKSGVVKPDGVEINGNFAQFINPVDIKVKRFRGLKRWGLDPDAEDQAQLVLEALES